MKPKTIITFSFICLALATGLAWYNHQYYRYGYPFVTMPSGLSYKRMRSGNGRKVQKGEWMRLSFEMTTPDNKEDQAAQVKQGNKTTLLSISDALCPFNDDFEEKEKRIAEMFGMVEERQRMVFKFSPQYFWEGEDPEHIARLLRSLKLKADDELVMDIKLDQIMTEEAAQQMIETRRTAQLAKEAERLAKEAAQLAKDKEAITAYLATHHIEASSTDSGLFYIIDQPSQDIPVVQNKTVKVNYTGKLLNGTVFDTSVEEVAKANNIYDEQKSYKPFEFSVGSGAVIRGWNEGLLLLKKNEKARFFIPSSLAYGEHGSGESIPANAILIFDIEVVDVI